MSRGLADSFQRYNHGEWIDCDGDPVEIELVVHAHWVKLERYGDARGRTHSCSKCGKHGYKDDKRCPECGAVMDEKVYEPTPIGKLLFSMRVYKRLKQAGILTMEQLQETDKQILHNIAGLGKQSILEIEEKLAEWKEKNNG
jgi:predicted amidophosphoribosyltransferase